MDYVSLLHKQEDSGFAHNVKRGTAYVYTDNAVNAFMATNKLSHIVRAHECFPEGYALFFDGKLISIFSCSRYCGINNKAAVVWVDGEGEDGWIKIVNIET